MTRYRASTAVAAEPVGEELLLVHVESGRTYRVNRTGRQIWELACASCSTNEIVERLQPGLKVPAETLAADVAHMLAALVGNGLLENRPEDRP